MPARFRFVNKYNQDGHFFAMLIHELTEAPKKLEWNMLKLCYNALACATLEEKNIERINAVASHQHYQSIVNEMQSLQALKPDMFTMRQRDVSFHSYAYELHSLRSSLSSVRNALYVEIGVWKGASSFMMARHHMNTRVVGIDPMELPLQHHDFLAFQQLMDPLQKMRLIQHRSTHPAALRELQQIVNGSAVDLLLIDGDHSYKATMRDFFTFAPLVRAGGYVVFDDFNDYLYSPGVRMAVLDLITSTFAKTRGCFDVIGTPPNLGNATGFPAFAFARSASNEFVVRIRKTGCFSIAAASALNPTRVARSPRADREDSQAGKWWRWLARATRATTDASASAR
jgi:cephalosporin hydroxylase